MLKCFFSEIYREYKNFSQGKLSILINISSFVGGIVNQTNWVEIFVNIKFQEFYVLSLSETLGKWAFELQRELVVRQRSACNAEKWFFMGKLFYLSFFSYASFLCKRFARDEVSYLNFYFLRAWQSLFTMILRTPSFKEILIDLAKVILAQSNGEISYWNLLIN